jgi:carbonic anhydrase
MHQTSDVKVTEVTIFLEAGSTNAAIQQLWKGMPITPGKEQEVVGVKVIPTVSCTP